MICSGWTVTQDNLFRLDGNRQKKRVRQPHSTADRHRKKALNDGEYIMEEGGGGRANYSVHFNLPDAGEYGEDHSSIQNNYVKSVLICSVKSSVADPGSGAFLTPGSGIRNRFFPDPGSRILDP
jgi:hypothetical protein